MIAFILTLFSAYPLIFLSLSSSASVTYVPLQMFYFNHGELGYSFAISSDGKTLVIRNLAYDNGSFSFYSFDENIYEFVQQGPGLFGIDFNASSIEQVKTVAINGNGSTVVFGNPGVDDYLGAAWIFTKNSSGSWNQQGLKLVGSGGHDDYGRASHQGSSVSIDFYGNTIVSCGVNDDYYTGAAWIFSRNTSNGQWTQQSPKLIGVNYTHAYFGSSSALSANGSVAVISSKYGSVPPIFGSLYIYFRDQILGSWILQSVINSPYLRHQFLYVHYGPSVAVSADAETILFGLPWDDYYLGAALVYAYNASASDWYFQTKLRGPFLNGLYSIFEARSVSLSSDGNTALIGGPGNNHSIGAAWVFTRDKFGNWSEVGEPLIPDALGSANIGAAVSLSGNATFAVVGGPYDNETGAIWVFHTEQVTLEPTASPTVLK